MAAAYELHDREVIHIHARLYEQQRPLKAKKFAVDPQITTFEIMQKLLTKAFDLKTDFAVSYLATDDYGDKIYLSLLSDWDLEAAFLCCPDEILRLKVDLISNEGAPDLDRLLELYQTRPHETDDWDVVASHDLATNRTAMSSIRSMLFDPRGSASLIDSIADSIVKKVGKVQQAIGIRSLMSASSSNQNMNSGGFQQPAAFDQAAASNFKFLKPPLSIVEYTSYLDAKGVLICLNELRLSVYQGGVEPTLRKLIWRHLLNCFPSDLDTDGRASYVRRKAEEYSRMKERWKREYANGEAGPELSRIANAVKKDVLRTDRSHRYFAGDDNQHVVELFNVLVTFALAHPSISYVQGMSDLAAPLLVVQQDESSSYLCFCALFRRLGRTFAPDGRAMETTFEHFRALIRAYDPAFFDFLRRKDAADLIFTYRWLLLELKREFPLDDACIMLEILWSSLPPTSLQHVSTPLGVPLFEQDSMFGDDVVVLNEAIPAPHLQATTQAHTEPDCETDSLSFVADVAQQLPNANGSGKALALVFTGDPAAGQPRSPNASTPPVGSRSSIASRPFGSRTAQVSAGPIEHYAKLKAAHISSLKKRSQVDSQTQSQSQLPDAAAASRSELVGERERRSPSQEQTSEIYANTRTRFRKAFTSPSTNDSNTNTKDEQEVNASHMAAQNDEKISLTAANATALDAILRTCEDDDETVPELPTTSSPVHNYPQPTEVRILHKAVSDSNTLATSTNDDVISVNQSDAVVQITMTSAPNAELLSTPKQDLVHRTLSASSRSTPERGDSRPDSRMTNSSFATFSVESTSASVTDFSRLSDENARVVDAITQSLMRTAVSIDRAIELQDSREQSREVTPSESPVKRGSLIGTAPELQSTGTFSNTTNDNINSIATHTAASRQSSIDVVSRVSVAQDVTDFKLSGATGTTSGSTKLTGHITDHSNLHSNKSSSSQLQSVDVIEQPGHLQTRTVHSQLAASRSTPCSPLHSAAATPYAPLGDLAAIENLPPPSELGGGNPFLLFLCLTILIQHRDVVMANTDCECNDIGKYFSNLVRKHNVHRVICQAQSLYATYLRIQYMKAAAAGSARFDSDR